MTQKQKLQKIKKLRAEFRKNGRLRIEFLADLSRLLRDHGIPIEDELLASIQLAVKPEIPDMEAASIDPPSKDPQIDPPQK